MATKKARKPAGKSKSKSKSTPRTKAKAKAKAKPKARKGKAKAKTKAKPAPKAKAKPAAATKARGAALIEKIVARITSADSPIARPTPLTAAQIAAAEQAAGVALSPSLHALLSYDAGYMKREYRWFDDAMQLAARPVRDVIGEHAGALASIYDEMIAARLPGKAIQLDAGSDSMRFLYFGDPDEHGEYPVLWIDHDDMPVAGVEYPGFDQWLADAVGVPTTNAKTAAEARCTQMFGTPWWDCQDQPETYPAAVAGPAPGTIAHAAAVAAAPRKLTDKQVDAALVEAATDGDVAGLAVLIGRGRKLDAAVTAAARAGRLAAIEQLLAAGANPDAGGRYGCPLSDVAGHPDEVALARALLAAGADPNGASVNGQVVLHQAVEFGSLELVRVLLDAGADPNRADDTGQTPVYTAVQRHPSGRVPEPAIFELLVDRGGDPDGVPGNPPLAHAIDDRRPEMVERLIARGADLEHVRHDGRRPLHVAFATGDDAIVRRLIAAGADRTAKDGDGIALDGVFGPAGEDARAIDVHYVASAEPQHVTIEARLAVLNRYQLGGAVAQLGNAALVALAEAGLAAGAEFDPAASRIVSVTDARFDDVTSNGIIRRRWDLEMAGVSPRFLPIVAARILNAVSAYTGAGMLATLRGVALSIRGDRPGDGLDGETLRGWLADPYAAPLGAYPGELPFAFAVVTGDVATVEIHGVADDDALHAALTLWLGLAPLWPARAPGFVFAMPAGDHRFVVTHTPDGSQTSSAWVFTSAAPIDALHNAMRAVHARTPLASVTLTVTP